MKLKFVFIFISATALSAPSAAGAHEPTITLAPDALEAPQAAEPPLTLRELVGTGRRLGLGGYGEAEALLDGSDRQAKLRRFVLFAGYSFTDWARLYSEIEIENGTELEMEQAYVDLQPRRWLGLRAGLLIVPLGILNIYHEPPTFLTVERPDVDQLIIPTTWRELGVGIYGTVREGLHYQLYAMNGLEAQRFNAAAPLVGGRGNGANSQLNDAAVTGRVNYTGLLGLDAGVGFYFGGAGQKVQELGGVTVAVVEADAHWKRRGFDVRAEYARVFIQGAARITDFQRQSNATAAAIPSAAEGFYAEVGYNVFTTVRRIRHELIPFIHYEYVNVEAAAPAGVLAAGGSDAKHYLQLGVAYRPHPQLIFKFDYRRRVAEARQEVLLPQAMNGEVPAGGENRFSFGVGFMF